MMHYRGRVFRPPFEENSLLIEATVGCSRDKCAFCSLYHDTPFSPSPMEDIESDIRFIGRNRTRFKRVFLVGGDPFTLPFKRLCRIGLRNYCDPRVQVIHLGGHSTRMSDNLFLQRCNLESADLYFRKYGDCTPVQRMVWALTKASWKIRFFLKKLSWKK